MMFVSFARGRIPACRDIEHRAVFYAARSQMARAVVALNSESFFLFIFHVTSTQIHASAVVCVTVVVLCSSQAFSFSDLHVYVQVQP